MVFFWCSRIFLPLQNPRYVTVTEIFSENEMRCCSTGTLLSKIKTCYELSPIRLLFMYSFIMHPMVIISSNFLIVITMDIWKRYDIAWCKKSHIFFRSGPIFLGSCSFHCICSQVIQIMIFCDFCLFFFTCWSSLKSI